MTVPNRTPVAAQVAAILRDAPLRFDGKPMQYSYLQLAAEVYDTESPTPAQLSAVRRAVAKLVQRGEAERTERWQAAWSTHTRKVPVNRWVALREGLPEGAKAAREYRNPMGV